MRPPITRPVALLLVFGLLFALAACKKEQSSSDKDKKGNGSGEGSGTTAVGPPQKVDPGHPAQAVAFGIVKDLKLDTSIDPARISTRFLKTIGKPITALSADKEKGYSAGSAISWLTTAGKVLGDATVSPPTGFQQTGVAVFTGSFVSPRAPNGRYLIRLVDEGGWKLDWFQASVVTANAAPAPANADDPFKDFTLQAAADLVADTTLSGTARAPLAAAILSPKLRTELDVNEKEGPEGYDYKRGWLGAKLDQIVGGKVQSYTRSSIGPDTYRVEATLEGGAKKAIEVKLVKGNAPGVWLVDEIKQLTSA